MTTAEVIEKLKRCGLMVSYNMIVQDAQDGYLPQRGRGRTGRLWEDWAVRRAVYLYRLRKRGVKGQVLKVLLYLRDGYGWEQVKPICLDGAQKLIHIQSAPLNQILRNPSPQSLLFVVPDLAEATELTEQTVGFFYGMSLFGESLDDGSIQPLASGLSILNGQPQPPNAKIELVQDVLQQLRPTHERLVEATTNATDADAYFARMLYIEHGRLWRRMLHGYHVRNGIKGEATNPKTLCNRARQVDFRALPKRITAAQMLAATLAPFMFISAELMHRPDLLIRLALDEFQ